MSFATFFNATAVPVTDNPRESFSTISYLVLTPIALACLVALNLNTAGRFAAFVGIVACYLAGTQTATGSPKDKYFAGLHIGFGCALALVELVLANPVTEWQHENEPGPLTKKPFWKRVWWIASLTYNPRCIGWTSQVPFVPTVVTSHRGKYVLRKLRQLLVNIIVLDFFEVLKSMDPWFKRDDGQVILPLSGQPYTRRMFVSMSSGAMACHIFSLQYNLVALAIVGLGIQEPRRWPDMFGSWSDAYTIRRFWARVWHQMARRFTAPSGKAASRLLRLKPGSWISARVQLIVGFTVSGLAHVPADYIVGPAWTGISVPFLSIQAVGITIEDLAISVAAAYGIKQSLWTRMVGYLWVWPLWFTLTVPLFTEWMVSAGILEGDVLSFSVVRPGMEYVQRTYGITILEYLIPPVRYAP